jgi:hypothetical protein
MSTNSSHIYSCVQKRPEVFNGAHKNDLIVVPELQETARGSLSKRTVSSLPFATCSVRGLSTLYIRSFSTTQALGSGSIHVYYQTYAKLPGDLG